MKKSNSNLWDHYIICHKDISVQMSKQFCPDIDNLKCHLCGKGFSKKERVMTHVGIVHRRLNNILRSTGLQLLKPPKINPIIKIKEEVALLDNSANDDTQLINLNSVISHKVTKEITKKKKNNEHENSIS